MGDHQPHHDGRNQRQAKDDSQMDQEGVQGHVGPAIARRSAGRNLMAVLSPLQNLRIDHHGRIGRAIQSGEDIARRRFRHARRAFFRACR